jgi:hypothetical protein
MGHGPRGWEGITPWRKLAEVAKKVIVREHSKINQGRAPYQRISDDAVYVSTTDFEAAFEPYIRRIRIAAQMEVMAGSELIRKQRELDDVDLVIELREMEK